MQLSPNQIIEFQQRILDYYSEHGRHNLPWRLSDKPILDPYAMVVSELMLQQTQVGRVIPKYEAFLRRFPTVQSLADASLGEVLIMWQGLGYNRRAKYLWQTAQQVMADYGGTFPDTPESLVRLPGIGANTAGAILAYAFNQPTIFIETNIRTVYIHHFFAGQTLVADKDITRLLEQTIIHDNPRHFYWALMDYGSYLKQTAGNAGARSKHYVRQSPFHGSRRQVRGAILRALSGRGYGAAELAEVVPDERRESVLADLQSEGMVGRTDDIYHLA